jgi:general stress protein 26
MLNAEKTIGTLADKASNALIGSVDGDGYPNVKAMLPPRKREGIKTFYFTTNTSAVRTAQYRANPKACVYFYTKSMFSYQGVMLKGTMEVLEDAAVKEAVWRPGDTLFYKQGVTDPDYCVLKFTAVRGRYYANFKNEDFEIPE